MNIDDTTIRKLTPEQVDKVRGLEEAKAKLLLLQEEREVMIDKQDEELVINMNRQQRRAWARKEAKKILKGSSSVG